MNIERVLQERSGSKCELCGAEGSLLVYEVPASPTVGAEASIFICKTCHDQLADDAHPDPNHWRCLNDSMWSPVPAVQVQSWRMLHRLKSEGWPQDLLDMMYMEAAVKEWAEAGSDGSDSSNSVVHRDSNGAVLEAGDSVVLIKDLKVKGSSLVAKQGTAVRRISLDPDNEKYIEGKVDGQQIVIITDFVKKVSS
ncbi:alkylphosphonate utilization protein [Altibacter sp.]|uniref:PhnA domain-containing protein n=1 Tax=Altibacter sp. TaxID=2024823 RepID=UPI00258B2800|nr:alkylphosphonate utilization protein [Altibacter sp.]MCW8980906.1 PhnA domain-containing protein [Altibacter sp.]MCW9036723.1 PhnA domain-containing protein [Altibacter sp.]